MKPYFFIVAVVLFSFSCGKYGVINYTHVEGFENLDSYFIEIDSTDLEFTYDSRTIQVYDENGEHSKNVLMMDKVYAFWIEKNSNSFTSDFDFNFIGETVKVDSISFLYTFKDSTFKDSNYNMLSENFYTINPSNYVSYTIKNEPLFDYKNYLIQDLIIFSNEKKFRFKNYILWN